MNITFIIGNGFDLNLGMKTQYSDMYKGYIETPSENKVIEIFKGSLSQRKPYDRWTDFEMGMADYAKKLSSEKSLIECVRDFKKHLVQHLRNEQEKVKKLFTTVDNVRPVVNELDNSLKYFYNSLSPNVVNEIKGVIGDQYVNYNFLTFNYTNTLEQAIRVRDRYLKTTSQDPVHIHGALDKDVVLGVDNLEQLKGLYYSLTNRGKRNFVKTLFNEQYDKERVTKARNIINESSIICTYGWAMGDSDKVWIDLLREWIITNPNHHLIHYRYSTKMYHRYNFDEIMDAEDDAKESVIQKLNITDESILDQIHIPVGHNIFNFGKINAEEKEQSKANNPKEEVLV